MSKTLFTKNNLYVRNKSHIVLNFQMGMLWFKVVNMCQFEIRVKQVYKDTVKAFLNGLCRHQTAGKQHS